MKREPFQPIKFANFLEETERYVTDNSLLYEWIGSHWRVMNDLTGERLAMRWLVEKTTDIANPANCSAAYHTALLCLPLLDSSKCSVPVIPLRNGYLYLDGGPSLQPHDKKLGLTYALACDFDPSAPPPVEFNKFLETVLPDKPVRERVQEYVGYTLITDARFQRAQIWIGSGANGKGALANIIQALHQHTAAVQLDALDGFKMASIIGASLIYCDEAPQRNICEQSIKSLIAGELMQIDRKYRDPISVRINGKWLILANHMPSVTDQSTGFWRRFDVVPFPVEIAERERDPMLAKRIVDTELSGVLNWALEGLQRLLSRGRFDDVLPVAMRDASQSVKFETNSVFSWVHDIGIERKVEVDTPKTKVYSDYVNWCRENGMPPAASPKFWKRLPDVIGKLEEGRANSTSGRIRTCNVRL
ncbi:DNA primase family protein [Leeia oryzae]|uniref:DNA primase family protein n=1 Tax=Leeia oryzae TaxID=356662 RepID=UPI0003677C94|nr:phage/plasmid primase, P4 family [Leeia oryzae]